MVDRATYLAETRAETVRQLADLGVKRLMSREELMTAHTARLARFARGNVSPSRWRHLRRCDGTDCCGSKCGAACAFAERYEIDDYTLTAIGLIEYRGQPIHSVTVIDPHYFRASGELDTLSINGMRQSFSRRMAAAPRDWGKVRAVGALDISLDRTNRGSEFWSAHYHGWVLADAEREDLRTLLTPRSNPNAHAFNNPYRPVRFAEKITNLANGLSYATKNIVKPRQQGSDRRQPPTPFRVKEERLLEHDRWLLTLRPNDRLILRGFKVMRGGLVLLR